MGSTRSPEPRGPLAILAQPTTPAASPNQADSADVAEPTQPLPSSAQPVAERASGLLWRGVKWPLRKLLLGAYLAGDGIRRRPLVALSVGALALAAILTGTAVVVATRPPAPPVVVEQSTPPPLPASVLRYLRARQRFDAAEMWAAYDASGHSDLKMSEAQLQTMLDQQRKAGLTITRYVYSGGFSAPDGTTRASIEVYTTEHGHASVATWYFVVGADGLIQRQVDLR